MYDHWKGSIEMTFDNMIGYIKTSQIEFKYTSDLLLENAIV